LTLRDRAAPATIGQKSKSPEAPQGSASGLVGAATRRDAPGGAHPSALCLKMAYALQLASVMMLLLLLLRACQSRTCASRRRGGPTKNLLIASVATRDSRFGYSHSNLHHFLNAWLNMPFSSYHLYGQYGCSRIGHSHLHIQNVFS